NLQRSLSPKPPWPVPASSRPLPSGEPGQQAPWPAAAEVLGGFRRGADRQSRSRTQSSRSVQLRRALSAHPRNTPQQRAEEGVKLYLGFPLHLSKFLATSHFPSS